jgi:GH24 family phage-related lysozyme (muramidase)
MNYKVMTSEELAQEFAYLRECWYVYQSLLVDAINQRDYALAASHLNMVDWCEELAWQIIGEANRRQEER